MKRRTVMKKNLLMAVSGAALLLSGTAWAGELKVDGNQAQTQQMDTAAGATDAEIMKSTDPATAGTAIERSTDKLEATDEVTNGAVGSATQKGNMDTTAGATDAEIMKSTDPATAGTAVERSTDKLEATDEVTSGAVDSATQQGNADRYGSYSQQDKEFNGVIAGGYSAEDLIGRDVIDGEGETVGEIDDLLIGANDTVEKVLVEVGGFLGMGEHRVALDISELQRTPDGKFAAAMSKQDVEALPKFENNDSAWTILQD